MKDITRISFEFPTHILPIIDNIAAERGITRAGLIRQSLGVMQALHEGAKSGLHVGMARNRENLISILVGSL